MAATTAAQQEVPLDIEHLLDEARRAATSCGKAGRGVYTYVTRRALPVPTSHKYGEVVGGIYDAHQAGHWANKYFHDKYVDGETIEPWAMEEAGLRKYLRTNMRFTGGATGIDTWLRVAKEYWRAYYYGYVPGDATFEERLLQERRRLEARRHIEAEQAAEAAERDAYRKAYNKLRSSAYEPPRDWLWTSSPEERDAITARLVRERNTPAARAAERQARRAGRAAFEREYVRIYCEMAREDEAELRSKAFDEHSQDKTHTRRHYRQRMIVPLIIPRKASRLVRDEKGRKITWLECMGIRLPLLIDRATLRRLERGELEYREVAFCVRKLSRRQARRIHARYGRRWRSKSFLTDSRELIEAHVRFRSRTLPQQPVEVVVSPACSAAGSSAVRSPARTQVDTGTCITPLDTQYCGTLTAARPPKPAAGLPLPGRASTNAAGGGPDVTMQVDTPEQPTPPTEAAGSKVPHGAHSPYTDPPETRQTKTVQSTGVRRRAGKRRGAGLRGLAADEALIERTMRSIPKEANVVRWDLILRQMTSKTAYREAVRELADGIRRYNERNGIIDEG